MAPRDLASLARLPNLPSVWSNVTTGYLLALVLGQTVLSARSVAPVMQPAMLAWLLAAATLLYLCGTFLNDAVDHRIDATYRSDRPIPSGRVKRGNVLNLGLLAGIGGLLCSLPAGKYALGGAACLLSLVLLYTYLHKRHAAATVLMAACRAGLPLLGAAGAITRWGDEWEAVGWCVLAAAALLFAYTLGISMLARREAQGGTGGLAAIGAQALLCLPFVVPVVALAATIASGATLPSWPVLAATMLVGCGGLGWVWFASAGAAISPATMVGRALAGLAIVDAVPLCLWLPQTQLAWLLVPCSAFLLALLLRRSVPAT